MDETNDRNACSVDIPDRKKATEQRVGTEQGQ